MAIWRRRRTATDDGPSPVEQRVIDDLAAPGADAGALIETTISRAATHAEVARTRADRVVIGFTLGAELDALATDIDRFDRTGDDRTDLLAARQLDARAVHLGNQALAQQRSNGTRAVTGAAAIIISDQQRST